ncbi:hypothetical protein ACPA9J_17765 [Pseudomonas aeruginosa]
MGHADHGRRRPRRLPRPDPLAAGLLHVARRFSSHLWHLLRYGRAMHLVNGVALVARWLSAEALGVRLIESAPARELLLRDGGWCRRAD